MLIYFYGSNNEWITGFFRIFIWVQWSVYHSDHWLTLHSNTDHYSHKHVQVLWNENYWAILLNCNSMSKLVSCFMDLSHMEKRFTSIGESKILVLQADGKITSMSQSIENLPAKSCASSSGSIHIVISLASMFSSTKSATSGRVLFADSTSDNSVWLSCFSDTI